MDNKRNTMKFPETGDAKNKGVDLITLQVSETITRAHFQRLASACEFHDMDGKTHILTFRRVANKTELVTLRFDMIMNGDYARLVNASKVSDADLVIMHSIMGGEHKFGTAKPKEEEHPDEKVRKYQIDF